MRTKASVHTLSGHTNAVATVRCQAAEPQIITGTIDTFQVYNIFISEIIVITHIFHIMTHYTCSVSVHSKFVTFHLIVFLILFTYHRICHTQYYVMSD